MGNQMAEWLNRAGPFKTVALPGSARPTQYLLDATVAELYGDFRAGRTPAAVLTVQFALVDQAGARPKVVYESTIARRVDLPQASPDALVRGYGKALEEILSQLVPEIYELRNPVACRRRIGGSASPSRIAPRLAVSST